MDLHAWFPAAYDGVLRTYAGVLLGLLLFAGVVLGVMTFGLRKDVKSIWKTYASWLVMGPSALAAIVLGRVAMVLFFLAFALAGAREFSRVTGLDKDRGLAGALLIAIAALGVTAMVDSPDGRPGWYGLFMAMPVLAALLFFLVAIVRNEPTGQLHHVGHALLGYMCVGWLFLHVALLIHTHDDFGYLLFLIFAVEICDVAAFTFGKLLGGDGRHKLRSNISPKKTWEGAIGALCVAMALPWAMRFSFPHFGTTQLVLTGLIVGVGGPMGDLAMSLIKRDVGVKDMGALIPGHGGALDRMDSLIFTAPLFLHMTRLFYGHW